MLRRKEDMKDWQKESLQEDKIVGRPAPDVIVYADAPEVPQEFIQEVKPKKAPAKKKTTKKVEKPVEEEK